MSRRRKGGALRARRYPLLDVIRGAAIVSMVLYHASWDLVYLAGIDWPWYHTAEAHLWQQSICWTFILLSGACMTLSHRRWRHGSMVFAAGLLVTGATLVFLPEERVVFGILTFLGSAMLITALLGRLPEKIPPICGTALMAFLFYVTRRIGSGILQLPGAHTVPLPGGWYRGMAATFLGFTQEGFVSTDYFPLMPWIFLFWAGYYGGLLLRQAGSGKDRILSLDVPPLSFLGRHSLLIYLLHQPLLYMAVVLCTRSYQYIGLW